MPNPVVHFEIQSNDPERCQKFFTDLFGWHIDTNNPMGYGFVDTHAEGEGINGGIGGAEGGSNRVTFYTQVDYVDAYLKKAGSLGGKTIMPRTVIPQTITLGIFADPEGNVVGLVEAETPS